MNIWQSAFCFLIYSFIGWTGESVLKTVSKKRPVNSGFLNGPICPIYGFGGFIMILLGKLLRGSFPEFIFSENLYSYVFIFLISFIILTVWEYIAALILEKTFHVRYWDYSGRFLNFQGRICLRNSVYWGLAGLGFVKLFEPWQMDILLPAVISVPKNILIMFDIAAYTLCAADIILSIRSVAGLENTLEKIRELGDTIRLRTEELELHTSDAAHELADDAIRLLNIRQTQLKLKMSSYAERMRKAFPTMKSEIFSRIETLNYDKKSLQKRLAELKAKYQKQKKEL